jgi:hypothetical protein
VLKAQEREMMKLPELNRHIVGLSAVAVAIAGLGYAASVMNLNYNRPVARLESIQPRAEQAGANGGESTFLSMLRQIPPNLYGRATEEDSQQPKPQERAAVSPKGKTENAASEAKNWTAQDWNVAAEAVEKLHSARAQTQNNTMTGVVWAPPEEIANKSETSGR